MAGRCRAGAAAQHHLAAHEFAVVFAHGAGRRVKAGVGQVGAGRPFPHAAPEGLQTVSGRVISGQGKPPRVIGELRWRRARQGLAARGGLPLELGRQTRTCPAGVGIGFVKTDVSHGRLRQQGLQAVQGHGLGVKAIAVRLPVGGCANVLLLHPAPAVGQPESGCGVAVVGDEVEPVGVAHRALGQGVVVQPDAVARAFVVEGEAFVGMADVGQTSGKTHPAHRLRVLRCGHGAGRGAGHGAIRGVQRVLRKQMQQIGEQQFLMLLLVVQPKFEQRSWSGLARQTLQRRIDMSAKGQNLFERRPGEQAALRARVARADGFVIRVEEIAEGRIEHAVARQMRREDELLEKPGGVRQMPFGRTGVGHGLHGAVGIAQPLHQRHAARASVQHRLQ